MTMSLVRHPEYLGIAQLGPGADFPRWAVGATLVSVTATATETSVISAYSEIPKRAKPQGPFVAFQTADAREFGDASALMAMLQTLDDSGIPVLTFATFGSDWILVPEPKADAAEEAWRRSDVEIQPATFTSD